MPQPRPLALLLATALLMGAASPARADDILDEHFDSPMGPSDGKVSTAKKVVVVTLLTGSVVSFGASFLFLFQANGAESDRKDLLSASAAGGDSGSAQCKTPAQCAELGSLKQKRDDAADRWRTAMVVGSGLAVATLATLILWPNVEREKVHVAPQAGPNGSPLCQRDVRQLPLDISVPMGGEWFLVRAQAFPDSRSINSSLGGRSQAA